MKITTKSWGGCVVTALSLFPLTAHSGGFALYEQSISGMGTAYAGASALASDPSTIFFNPAGMTLMPGTQATAGVHLLVASTKFSDEGSTFVNTAPIGGDNGGDAGAATGIPHTAFTHQAGDRLWLGLTINAPFGTSTEYNNGWVGRYHALESSLMTVNVNPSIAYRVNDKVSIGAGVSAMYADARLTNAVDWGLIAGGAAAAGTLDGVAEIEADDWAYGFNLGALFELGPGTRIGIHYRSKVEQEFEGTVVYGGRPAALAAFFPDAGVSADVEFPATASISVYHELDPSWAVSLDYTWTDWSSIPELRFDFDSVQADGVTTLDWKDTSRVAIGAIYQPGGSAWVYRGGFAYDESPIPNPQVRTPRLPGADRYWLSLGAGYRYRDDLTFDIAYTYVIIDDAEIRKTATGEDLTRGALNGSYEADVHLLSAQLTYRF